MEHEGIDYWVGWSRIMALYNQGKKLDQKHDDNQRTLYFSTIFETGGRRREVMLLRPEQIEWNEDVIMVRRMEVLKRRRRYTRNVIIRRDDNPLAQNFVDFVENCKTPYLLPARIPFTGEIDPSGKHISHSTINRKINEISPDIWPHWIRDQRSWHLSTSIEEGGRGFDIYLLKDWFEWKSIDMPAHYAGRRGERDIMKALGITKLPRGRK